MKINKKIITKEEEKMVKQIMYALMNYWCNIDEEDITTDGHLIFTNDHYEEIVEFCGKDGEYYHFVTSGRYNEYEEFDYFIKIENGAAYAYKDGIIDSLIVCLNKEKNNDFYIKNGTKHIYDSAFKNCNFSNVIVPDSVGYISKYDFLHSNIKKITLKSRRTIVYDKEDENFMKIIKRSEDK